jgi:hypothetical protein
VDAVLDVIGNAKTKQLENQAMGADMTFDSYGEEHYDAGRPIVSGYSVLIDSNGGRDAFLSAAMVKGRDSMHQHLAKQIRRPKQMGGWTAHLPPHAPEVRCFSSSRLHQ